MSDQPNPNPSSQKWPSIEECVPDEQGGPVARSGFTYQDYIAAGLVFQMLSDADIEQVNCETMDDVVIVRSAKNGSVRSAEYVQVKTTKEDSLWSCARLCGSVNDEAGASIFEKSLARDRAEEEALFRIVTLQGVRSALRPLTFPRGNSARDISAEGMKSLKDDIDLRCPNAKSPKGTNSVGWLERVLWVEGEPLPSLRTNLTVEIMKKSMSDRGQGLFHDQAERVLEALLAWVRKAGDAKFIPDKEIKIIRRTKLKDWWDAQLDKEKDGLAVPSGGKLRRKMTADIASTDMVENALQLRRQYSEEVRSPKYLEPSEIEKVSMEIRAKLMTLRTQRFTGENDKTAKEFHLQCQETVSSVAQEFDGNESYPKAMALGCLYDIVDRCQLTFSSEGQ